MQKMNLRLIVALIICVLLSACSDDKDYYNSRAEVDEANMNNYVENRSIKEITQALRNWLIINAPEFGAALNGQASAEQISALNDFFKGGVPNDLEEFLSVIDGQNNLDKPVLQDGFIILSAGEIILKWNSLRASVAVAGVNPRLPQDYGPVKGYIWNEKWIPFAENASGDYYCIDLDPTEMGHRGQIITKVNGDSDLNVLAHDIKSFIGLYQRGLENGDVVYDQRYDLFRWQQ